MEQFNEIRKRFLFDLQMGTFLLNKVYDHYIYIFDLSILNYETRFLILVFFSFFNFKLPIDSSTPCCIMDSPDQFCSLQKISGSDYKKYKDLSKENLEFIKYYNGITISLNNENFFILSLFSSSTDKIAKKRYKIYNKFPSYFNKLNEEMFEELSNLHKIFIK